MTFHTDRTYYYQLFCFKCKKNSTFKDVDRVNVCYCKYCGSKEAIIKQIHIKWSPK